MHIHLECEGGGEHNPKEHVVLSEQKAMQAIVLVAYSHPISLSVRGYRCSVVCAETGRLAYKEGERR
jgi:hypothetical protein